MANKGRPLATQLIEMHLVDGGPVAYTEIAIRIDQTLTQDATGTVALGDELRIPGVCAALRRGNVRLDVRNAGIYQPFVVRCDLNERERAIVLAGGALARAKEELALQLVTT